MRLKIAITFCLATCLLAPSGRARADDAPATAQPDSAAASTTTDPAKPDAATAPPQMDPAMAAALAQAMKLLAQTPTDTSPASGSTPTAASAATANDAEKTLSPFDVTKEIANDPGMSAAILQAAKMLAQSLQDPSTVAAMQKDAGPLSAPAAGDEKLILDSTPKEAKDEAKDEAQAEIEEAQQMADTAMANASQAAAAASSNGTVQAAASAAKTYANSAHDSLNGLVNSAQSMGPDESDKNHHSMDSLF